MPRYTMFHYLNMQYDTNLDSANGGVIIIALATLVDDESLVELISRAPAKLNLNLDILVQFLQYPIVQICSRGRFLYKATKVLGWIANFSYCFIIDLPSSHKTYLEIE